MEFIVYIENSLYGVIMVNKCFYMLTFTLYRGKFQPFTIFVERSILDVWQGFEYTSITNHVKLVILEYFNFWLIHFLRMFLYI